MTASKASIRTVLPDERTTGVLKEQQAFYKRLLFFLLEETEGRVESVGGTWFVHSTECFKA